MTDCCELHNNFSNSKYNDCHSHHMQLVLKFNVTVIVGAVNKYAHCLP